MILKVALIMATMAACGVMAASYSSKTVYDIAYSTGGGLNYASIHEAHKKSRRGKIIRRRRSY